MEPDGALRYERHLTRQLSQTLIWVRFEGERLPVDCEAYTKDTVSGEVMVRSLPSARSAHHIVRNFGPGKMGIRWRW